ncbi:DEAD/DEAH box helicase family protein [Erysipelothrix rhusiopathiae]|nr:DEAD/DEAH box helicase family protein [Erysipelothrix rhusiopathiae]MDE8281722.1 DEAD/DEAH box helicase family protein [Erysipelothrix rhusiopathiae]MDE8322639.1 DEAD/DEAH box helicase family protein [Erysipelothrix rhusiopathiae]
MKALIKIFNYDIIRIIRKFIDRGAIMSFKSLSLRSTYRTIQDDVVSEFYNPVLENSVSYISGTGFFTMSSLIEVVKGILPMIKKGYNINIMTSPLFKEDDITFLKQVENELELVTQVMNESLDELVVQEDKILLELFAALIRNNSIDIRVIYMNQGIYHEKIGIAEDCESNKIMHLGSLNMTNGGLRKNLESISVFKSWDDFESIDNNEAYLWSLWNNEIEDLKSISLPIAVQEKIIHTYSTKRNISEILEDIDAQESDKTNGTIKRELYRYQEIAINEYLKNGYCHFFEMATGTGKTFTTIQAINKTLITNGATMVFVVVPQIDLIKQWRAEFVKSGQENNIYLLGGGLNSMSGSGTFGQMLRLYTKGNSSILITTYDSFFLHIVTELKKFDSVLDNCLLVIDEAHNITENQFNRIPNFSYRIGLSATPDRREQGFTNQVIEYFTRGKIETYKYTLEQAIENGFLSRYNYYPIYTSLSESEFEKYKNLSVKIAQLLNSNKKEDKDLLEMMLLNRSLILKKAESKLSMFDEMVSSDEYDFKNSVVYCGPGKLVTSDENIDNIDEQVVDAVSKIMHNNGGYDVKHFTSKTENRNQVIKDFEEGYYDALIAIRCFDEGVDVPKLDKIYIMSSDSNKRQTIQRRGRVLRKCRETGKTIASIYDFVALPPDTADYSEGRSLILNEFKRVREYVSLAENKSVVSSILESIEIAAGIEEKDYDNESK